MRISFLSIISSLAAFATAESTAPQATTTRTPDRRVVFFAQLYSTSSNCSTTAKGGVKPFLYNFGKCQNIAITGNGSARIQYTERPELSLTGWTGTDCTGDSVVIGSSINLCVPLNGTSVASWSY
ncbi:hypothetical protein F5B20DRAFT_593722 [Whalleya microplaca]|nr:hypothetical protein F5B20DRAFT_593722 [Whalleya microplaca]